MPGFLSDQSLEPNSIELALKRRRALGLPLIDLTDTNPTHNGFIFPAEVLSLAAAKYWPTRRYDPDPRGLLLARDAVSEYYSSRTPSLKISADDIFITASTSESYSLLFSLLCEPGDNILVPAPSYPLFDLLAQHQKVELRSYPLNQKANWAIDQAGLRPRVDPRTRAVLIISPHNPTGAVLQRAVPELESLALPVICDEVFSEFPYAVEAVPALGSLYPGLPVCHLNGISKMFALPDLKLGWIAMNRPAAEHLGPRLEVLNDTLLGANSLVQSMLPSLFKEGKAFLSQMQTAIQKNVDFALAQLAQPPLHAPAPDGAYFLFPRLADGLNDEATVLRLIEAGVLVHPGYFYGSEDGSHLMLSCLKRREELEEGLGILRNILQA
jgi:alanine-synthesizing transaminase